MAILQIIKNLLLMLITFGQNKGKKLTEKVVEVEGELKMDKKQDKHLRRESKILYSSTEPFTEGLYIGNKGEMIKLIDQDLGKILSLKQERIFRKEVFRSTATYFSIQLHPLTLHP